MSFFGAEYILRIISSESFVTREIHGFTSIDAFEVVSPIFVLYFVSSLATYILIARNQERKMLIINTIIAVINIIGNLILIPMYSFV